MNKLLAALLGVLLGTSIEAEARSASPRWLSEVAHDTSAPLGDIAPIPPELERKAPREKRRPLEPRRHRGRGKGGPLLPDPVVQDTPGTFSMPTPGSSFEGVDNVDGVLPPDPNGAVGPNHYVQWVNTSFAIYDKSGTLLYGPAEGNTLWSGFGGPCEFDNEGDPIVLHDHLADRWFMSQLALPNFPDGPFYQCIAVSQTGDPTGAYNRYEFVVSDTKLNDYPKFAVWPDGYYLTVNQFDAFTSAFLGQGVLAFERDNMLAGRPARMVYFDLESVDPDLGGMLPADMDGPAPPEGSPAYFVQFDDDASGSAPQDQLQLWRFHVDWSDPSASTFTGPTVLATAPFDSSMCNYSRNCIPQAGTPRKLDAISDRLMYRLQYRNFGTYETLVVNHTVDVGGDHAGIRWYEIRDPGGAPFIQQQGTYAPDAAHRWMASAAMDGAGDLAIGFSVSGSSTFPSIRYAGRLASDPLGVLSQGESTLISGSGSQTDVSGRWGDYSALSVDPTDNCTFWYTQEYYATISSIGWQTRIGAFRFPSCTSSLPSVTVEATVATTPEAGTSPGIVTVRRSGSTAAALDVTYTVRGTATPGSDYVTLPGTVTIPAGAASATIEVMPIDDSLIEDDETVVVTASADPAYMVGTPSSAIVTIVNDDFAPDLVVATFSAPASGGAGTPITVSDTTKNQGRGAGGASTTRFFLSVDPTLDAADVPLGARAVPALAPGDTSAGSVVVTIPATTVGGAYYLIAKADADAALVESDEGNNASVKPIAIGPDLTIAALTVPATAGAGLTVTVSDTTRNQGAGAAQASATAFYLSTDATLDARDIRIGQRAVPGLQPGETSAGSTTLTVPAGVSVGTYYVIASADADGAVAETTESNNTSARQVQIGPDLLITALSVPSTAGAGATITVSDTTKNQGGGAAGASTMRFFLSTNATVDGADVALGSRAVPALAPGATSSGATGLVIPAGTAVGTYFIIARADADGVVPETAEGNNTVARAVQIGADLAVSALTAPTMAAAGASITVSDTTKNQGSGAAGASTTAFYLSTNAVFEVGDVLLGSRAVPSLAAGATSSAATVLAIPAGTATGTYYVVARADADDVVAETQETNNTSARQVQIGPDLFIPTLTVPGTAAAGATITVSDTTKNQGAGAAGMSTTRFFLSTNATLDGADVLLGSRIVPALPAGATSSGTTDLTIPPDTAVGTYFVIARADADDAIAETAEGNNNVARAVQIGADLVVSALTVPTTAAAGATIAVSDTTKNQGSGPADPSTTTFYLSTNPVVDVDDVLLGSRAVPALAAGAASSGSTVLGIPAGTATGTYYVVARADAADVVAETQEANNTSARQIQIGPDLLVPTLTVPGTAAAGATITVSDTTKNQGGGAAGASTTRFYLSTDSTFDAADLPLASRAVAALAAGATSSGSTGLTIPADTAVGTYYIIARADADDVVPETAEGNNNVARAVQIGADLAVSALTVPTTAAAGATITVSDTTKNQGGGPAAGSTTAFYLSTNAVFDVGDVLLSSRAVPGLAAGATSTASTVLGIPAGTATGTYFIVARADADDAVVETQEGNNTSARQVQIGPDLLITTLTVPGTATAGGTITVSDTTRNQGGGAAGASTTRFYLSTDSTFDAGDLPLASRAVAPLAAGATSTGTTGLTIPADTPVGTYSIIVRADADDAVTETVEGNNTVVRSIQIGPAS